MIPVANSLLYIQPLYVESSRNAIPVLQQVIAVYAESGGHRQRRSRRALPQVFTAPVSITPGGTGTTGTLSPQVAELLNAAQQAYPQSQADLKAGNLGAYQTDIQTLEENLQEVQQLTGGSVAPGTAATTTTTTTSP